MLNALLENRLTEREKQIIEVARKSFLTYGYAGTNVDQIAQEVGIGKGTVYRHFKSKAYLFIAVVLYTYQEMIAYFLPIPQISDPAEAFVHYLHTLIELNRKLKPFFALLNPMEFGREFQHDCGDNPEVKNLLEHFQQQRQQGIQLLVSLIERLQKAGALRNDIAPQELSRMMFVLINNYFRKEPGVVEEDYDNEKALLDFIFSGLNYKGKVSKEDRS
ncbi:TetR/AcrR family transcriptional regulator [Thermospira aquatica]|uniref:TetR/AcrR family transcriptional regulator n=1 Tax=Thermospira aquatica TaxID=2828656 RepID=A0AAX3BB10_9SPIR|nr:TetR/AcrR family transcriptional regulator [Thermospira aquatica]URA09270.1 TetR/AcrR family transcriptional regulator [Thermospira aquatica]